MRLYSSFENERNGVIHAQSTEPKMSCRDLLGSELLDLTWFSVHDTYVKQQKVDTDSKVTLSSLNQEEGGKSFWILCVILSVDIIGKNRNRDVWESWSVLSPEHVCIVISDDSLLTNNQAVVWQKENFVTPSISLMESELKPSLLCLSMNETVWKLVNEIYLKTLVSRAGVLQTTKKKNLVQPKNKVFSYMTFQPKSGDRRCRDKTNATE